MPSRPVHSCRLPIALLLLAAAVFPASVRADEAPPTPDTFEIETLTDGYAFTEGPALAPDGSIYFSDIPRRSIHRFDPATGETALITDNSGGSNGLMFTPDGNLFVCEDRDQRISLRKPSGPDDGLPPLSVAAVVRGAFNGPNDVAISKAGHVAYFTDPDYGNRNSADGVEGVYLVDLRIATRSIPAQHPHTRIIDDLQRPNGIGLSPDDRTLYVADNAARKLFAYPLDEDGQRDGDGQLFHDLADLGGPDGMTVDAHGRLFVAIYDQGILILSPDGEERLGFIPTGAQTTNCTFGADGITLYVTADHALKRVVVE